MQRAGRLTCSLAAEQPGHRSLAPLSMLQSRRTASEQKCWIREGPTPLLFTRSRTEMSGLELAVCKWTAAYYMRPVSLAALSAGRSTFWGIPVLADGLCFNAAVTGASRPRQNSWMFCLYADLFKLKKKKTFFLFSSIHFFFPPFLLTFFFSFWQLP